MSVPSGTGRTAASPEAPGSLDARIIRVASVPAGHVYVRHIAPLPDPGLRGRRQAAEAVRIVRLADPDPDGPRRSSDERWWPPAMLTAAWVRENADSFDVFHLQFGFDARTVSELEQLVLALGEAGKPLVFTVHDLRNPRHPSRREHDARLDVLIPAADALITLTPGAAYEIRRRWARFASVIPHPHVVEFDAMRSIQHRRFDRGLSRADVRSGPASPGGAEYRIGVHVKSLRASMSPLPVIRALLASMDRLPWAVLQVDGHSDVLREGGARYDDELASFLAAAASDGVIDLRIHDYFTDADFWDYLSSIDLSVLTDRFGTHSGWLEACRDVGTAVLAPSCGYYRDQAPVLQYLHDEDGLDEFTLDASVLRAYAERPVLIATAEERRRQRAAVALSHELIYRGLVW